MKISQLLEADDDKKKTKTKEKPDLSAYTKPKLDQPIAKASEKSGSKQVDDEGKRKLKTASKSRTADAVKNVDIGARGRDLIDNLPDMGGDDEPDTPSTDVVVRQATDVPATISSALKAAGVQDPDFHLVSNLPGNMKQAIRQLGKALFGSLTKTKTDEISMIGNMGGMGPNSRAEVNAVANYLKDEAKDLGPGDIDFDKIMPGYKARIHNYEADGIHWMLVRDDWGDYIYTWPAQDTLGREGKTKKLK